MKRLLTGMRLDELPVDQSAGSWRWAQNQSVFQRGSAITNEDGVDDVTPNNYPINKNVIGSIPMNEDVILFFGTTNPVDSEIGIFKSDFTYETILKDAIGKIVLDFNQNYPIQGVFEKKFNDNIIIAWTDYNNSPRILNIDCIPFRLLSNKSVNILDLAKAQSLIKLFPNYITPTILEYNLEVKEGAGSLLSGTYYPIIQYRLLDGSYTSWSKVYNGVPIYSSNINQTSTEISGGQPGSNTNKGIEITFDNIDLNYKSLRIGYLYSKNSIVTPYYEKEIKISSSQLNVIITGRNQTALTLNEVLIPNSVYSKAKSITTLQKRLYLASVEEDTDFNYQTYANQITLQWIRSREISINGPVKTTNNQGTYQNPTNVFFNKSFKSGECYAFYIVFKLKNGLYTKAFHIPGRQVNITDKDIMNPDSSSIYYNYNQLDSNNPIYRYQVLNTHTNATDTRGNLGFWENENEEYPLNPNNSSQVHPDFATIPGISVNNRKVRHHVFPDLSYLDNNGNNEKFLTGSFIGSAGTYPVDDIKTKAFGISVSNVNIPVDLLPLVDSYEIYYAQRDNSNIRIIGSDCPSNNGGGGIKFQQFDLMAFKPNLAPNYLKPVYRFQNDGQRAGQESNFVEDLYSSDVITYGSDQFRIRACTDFAYLGQDTTIPVNNTGLADNVYVFVPSAAGVIIQSFDIDTTGVFQNVVLCDLCIYRRNVYLNFDSQNLVSSGYSFKISNSGMQNTAVVYGGDVHINRHSVNPKSSGTRAFAYICESASNIGLRNEDVSQAKYFAPKYSNPTPSWFGYNKEFNCVNIYNQISIYYPSEFCLDQDVKLFNHKIPFSDVSGDESSSLGWRSFRINNYYELVKNKGKIWNILGSDRTLYIQTEYTLFLAQIKDKLNTNEAEIFLGTSDIFDRPPYEVITTSDGFAGSQSQYACILCKIGYCFIDRQKGKVFLLANNSLKEISDNSVFNYFLEHSQTSDKNIDNPFIGMGYTIGYNDRNNTIIICKRDDNGFDFTISYCPDLANGEGGWVSFHKYKPNYIVYNRSGFFGIDNSLFKILKHNSEISKCKFYDGTVYESYIDVVFNEDSEITKKFDNVNWISLVEKDGVSYKKLTATGLMVYNDTQCSGIINLKANNGVWFGNDVKNSEDTWNFNNFRDLIKNVTSPFLTDSGELLLSNIKYNKPWFEKSKFISKFIVFRIIYNNDNQYNFHLSQVGTNTKKSDR